MIYVDTSVFVAAFTMEPVHTRKAQKFLMQEQELQSSLWAVTEFSSALMMKLRRGDINDSYREEAWQRFKELLRARPILREVPGDAYEQASELVIESNELRAADALHLAAARQLKCDEFATFDKTLARVSSKFGVARFHFT